MAPDSLIRREGMGSSPAVGAFWSLTMYDADGFQVANPINCFASRDGDPLTYN